VRKTYPTTLHNFELGTWNFELFIRPGGHGFQIEGGALLGLGIVQIGLPGLEPLHHAEVDFLVWSEVAILVHALIAIIGHRALEEGHIQGRRAGITKIGEHTTPRFASKFKVQGSKFKVSRSHKTSE
jgi:hypothetical protein